MLMGDVQLGTLTIGPQHSDRLRDVIGCSTIDDRRRLRQVSGPRLDLIPLLPAVVQSYLDPGTDRGGITSGAGQAKARWCMSQDFAGLIKLGAGVVRGHEQVRVAVLVKVDCYGCSSVLWDD